MSRLSDRYATVGKRDFAAAIEHLLETEFKLVGSHRVIRVIAQAVIELHREFYPETKYREPGTIAWATTKAGAGAKVSWGKRAEEYGIQVVHLPLVTKEEIESRMAPGPGRDPRDNRRKEFHRDMATMVRLVRSAAEQGGLLTGAELSVLMNRSLMKIHDYIRTHERETGEALPLKGYVLDMGSSPNHKGIICRKLEQGMSPPDIARATGHTLSAVDNYLGAYERIKVLLHRAFDAPTICQVTGKAPRTVAQYLSIVQRFHPDRLADTHRDWLLAYSEKNHKRVPLPTGEGARMIGNLESEGTKDTCQARKTDPGASGESGSDRRYRSKAPSRRKGAKTARNHSPDKCPNSK